MKLIYIASPYAGDIEQNTEFARQACRYCIEQGHAPIAVHLLYPQILDDDIPEERSAGLCLGQRALEACDEMWVCGSRVSTGMRLEMEHARRNNIPIAYIGASQIYEELEEPNCISTLTI